MIVIEGAPRSVVRLVDGESRAVQITQIYDPVEGKHTTTLMTVIETQVPPDTDSIAL